LTLLRLRPILYSKVEERVKEESMPLTIVEIERDPYYKRGIERGIELGLKQGIEKGIEQGIERGRREGEYRKAIKTARKMYEEGIRDVVFISRITGIEIDRLREILRV